MILLNGPPGAGKSTLARRFAQDHWPTLNLDVDRVRDLIGDVVPRGKDTWAARAWTRSTGQP